MATIVCRIIEVCVFRFINDRAEYLVLKRSPTEKMYPGLWQFVSGSIEDREKAVDAALRELKEETGMSPKRFWVVPHTNTFYDPSPGTSLTGERSLQFSRSCRSPSVLQDVT